MLDLGELDSTRVVFSDQIEFALCDGMSMAIHGLATPNGGKDMEAFCRPSMLRILAIAG